MNATGDPGSQPPSQRPPPSLLDALARVPDPRHARGRRHPWLALLVLLVVALLCGANSQRGCARWIQDAPGAHRRRLGFTRSDGPSRATVNRLLHQVDVVALEGALSRWAQQVRATGGSPPTGPGGVAAAHWVDGIAVDGKTLRGARHLGVVAAHLVSACCQQHGLVLGQVAVPDQTNELGAVVPLLAQVAVAGETVTFDALFTQVAVAAAVVAQGGAYLMVVKANQPTLRRACEEATADRPRRPRRWLGQIQTTRKAHGRLEQRTLVAVAAPADLGWPHARQVLRLRRRRVDTRTGRIVTDETVYAVTSLCPEQATPQQLLTLWQRHWWVENREHWVRDVVFGEDASTTHTGTAPHALAALRNLVLSLLHWWHRPDITAARQYYATHPTALFRRLGLRRL